LGLYDVVPDGQRFIFNVASTTVAAEASITVVPNWQAALRRD
jgi:hypothetical protein